MNLKKNFFKKIPDLKINIFGMNSEIVHVHRAYINCQWKAPSMSDLSCLCMIVCNPALGPFSNLAVHLFWQIPALPLTVVRR